jgi:hypothetical protein
MAERHPAVGVASAQIGAFSTSAGCFLARLVVSAQANSVATNAAPNRTTRVFLYEWFMDHFLPAPDATSKLYTSLSGPTRLA